MNPRIEVLKGDITQLDVDAIVNAANSSLIGSSGVAAAIQRAAGPKMIPALRALGGCDVGDAKITPGFQLPAKYVIHTVGPVWYGGDRGEDEALANCYRRSLALAAKHGIRTIAFPAISTGVYRFPPERAAQIAVREVQTALASSTVIDTVYLVGFDDRTVELYQSYLTSR